MTDPEPLRPAVLIPTYNNAGTLGEVLEGVLERIDRAFRLLTGVKLRDTQAGFRAYPLDAVQALDLRGCHYDLEMEVLIKAAWSGMPIQPVIIDVSYAPTHGRVSRFRPVTDFARIGWMALRLLSDRRS